MTDPVSTGNNNASTLSGALPSGKNLTIAAVLAALLGAGGFGGVYTYIGTLGTWPNGQFRALDTALILGQPPAKVATSGSYNDLINTPNFSSFFNTPAPAGQFSTGFTGGVPSFAQVAFGNLSGTASAGQIPFALQRTGDTSTGLQSITAQTTPFSAWGAYLGNTGKPLPSTWGSFCAPTTGQSFPSMTGIVAANIGDTSGEAYTQCLVQWQTQYGNNHSESGLAINTLSQTGGGGAAQTGYNEKVGLYMPTILAPGGSNTWAANFDTTILSGVGKYPAFGLENDFTNFNGPYTNAADGIGVSATYFNTFLSSFPITAGELWSAGNQANAATVMTVSTTAGQATATVTTAPSGGYGGLYIGEMLKDSQNYFATWTRFTSYSTSNGTTTVTLNAPASTTGSTQLTFTPSGAQYGFLVNSSFVFQDATYADFGNAQTSVLISGTHQVGISMGAGVQYAMALNQNQPACFLGLSVCLYGNAAGLNSDHQFIAAGFTETLSTPASSSAACTAGQFGDDANYHYVCTATNTWKRVALSTF